MRCLNCGWDNQPDVSFCQKCGQPLQAAPANPIAQPYSDALEPRPKKTVLNSNMENERNRKTARFVEGMDTNTNSKPSECSNCGYPISPQFEICPNCGTALRKPASQPVSIPQAVQQPLDAQHRQTVRGFIRHQVPDQLKPKCKLTQIAEDYESFTPVSYGYQGDRITLNRDNTEPTNNTITSHEQAELIYKDGKWILKDKSNLNTTFVYAGREIELQSGDIIVLGNRRFRFEQE